MNKLLMLVSLFVLFFVSCNSQYSKPLYVATCEPVAQILKEIIGTKGEIMTLVPVDKSPHTFSPNPSDAYKIKTSKALFYVSDIFDGWATKFDNEKKIELLSLIPEEFLLDFDENHEHDGHEHHEENLKSSFDSKKYDPHFWTDPLVVKALLKKLTDTLSIIDPKNATTYKNNASTFEKRLDLLDRQLSNILNDVRGKQVLLFHPSFRYLLSRYNLKYIGSIEISPGKEPTALYLSQLSNLIKNNNIKAIFTEPQLSKKPVEIVAEGNPVLIYTLDPLGGQKGNTKYSNVILKNARTLSKALK